jgi:long-chain acyl-CoA synthetase
LRAEFQRRIEQRLAGLSPHEQVRRFALVARPFTPEEGELTPKLSLRRDVIASRYRDLIDALYES